VTTGDRDDTGQEYIAALKSTQSCLWKPNGPRPKTRGVSPSEFECFVFNSTTAHMLGIAIPGSVACQVTEWVS
jgi:hypothetical protein